MKTTPLIHIVRLARRLNAAVVAEGNSRSAALLEDFKAIADAGYKFLLAAGIMSVLAYLLISIKFYPSGVTIGDALFFVMVALAFSFAYGLFLMFGFLIGKVSLYIAEKIKKNRLASYISGFILIVLYAFVVIGYHESTMVITLCQALLGFSLSGISLAMLIDSLDGTGTNKSSKSQKLFFGMGVLLCPLVLSSAFVLAMNEKVVMPSVGVRLMNVSLNLSEENFNILASAAKGQNLAALACSTSSSGQPERMVHGVNLLWHGIGERSLVELPSDRQPNLIVELKREGVFALRNYNGAIERCLELEGDVLFEAGSSELSSELHDLDEMLKVIRTKKSDIERIQVIGHSDAFGYPGGAKKNNQLALARANKVKQSIVDALRPSQVVITAIGHGSREPKTLCKDWPVKATLSECLVQNRRVVVRMEFKSTPLKTNRTTQDLQGEALIVK